MSESHAPEDTAKKSGFWTRLRERDHTQGSLFTSLLVLALPLVATSLSGGVLFQLVDLKLISGLGDQSVTAVVVTNQSLRQVFFMLIMPLCFAKLGVKKMLAIGMAAWVVRYGLWSFGAGAP